MIIHIDGPICSGKSTLAKKLAINKKYFILDLDKIWDNEFLKYLKIYNIKSIKREENEKVIKIADKNSKIMLNKYIEKNKKKHVILIGFGIDVSYIKELIKYGLNIDFESSLCTRTASRASSGIWSTSTRSFAPSRGSNSAASK
jgi:adenylate kinase family enzyme